MGVISRIIVRIIKHAARCEEMAHYAHMNIGYASTIGANCDINPPENIEVGQHTSIGTRNTIWTTRAKVKIGNYVITGPQVTIISGNHIVDHIGKHIAEFDDSDKELFPNTYDKDIIIDDGVWIGANATILSGVHIAEGCVIAAGAVVTKSTIPYGIYGGVPAKLIKMRFTSSELTEHLNIMRERAD